MNGHRSALIPGFLVAILLIGATARAQDTPHNGFAMGYPAAAGILLNVGDNIALWPELVAARHASTTSNSSETDVNAVGAGVRVLLYLTPVQAFRPYIVPQFDYTRSRSTSPGSAPAGNLTTTVSTYSGAASFGAQYAVSARFGVFGEVGLEYAHSTGSGFITSHGNATGTRNAVGVLVFF